MAQSILVVAAHPDDEILGCGGVMARHAQMGDSVNILIVAEGATSRSPSEGGGDVDELQTSARRAAGILGANEPEFLGLPDNRLDSLPLLDVIKPVEKRINEIGPSVVYTHHAGDLNIDHRIVHQSVMTACRPLPGCSVTAIFAFEVLSSTEWGVAPGGEFVPNHFVNIDKHLEKKLAALGCYEGEMRPFPHARSLEAARALALVRGSAAGLRAAEAFVTLRERIV